MPAYVTFFPLGNADCAFIELNDKRHVLVDFGNMRDPNSKTDLRCDLAAEVRTILRKAGRKEIGDVCFTHLDDDHCKGMGAFFWLRHAAKYQSDDRVRIGRMWVPACALTEKDLIGDALLVQEEAKHRLCKGDGILILSRPERLKEWMEQHGIDYEKSKVLFVDAGKPVPGFSTSGPEGVEFFVHSPFAARQDNASVIDRNGDSIVFQATFKEEAVETYALFGSDVNHEVLAEIVRITKAREREGRLRWHLIKLPHHSSYLSLGTERGTDETVAVPEVKWLFEEQGQKGAYIVSTSWPIPAKGSDDDKGDQPPHRQAANHHRRIALAKDGKYIVTMEEPNRTSPASFKFEITRFGLAFLVAAPSIITTVTSSTMRQG